MELTEEAVRRVARVEVNDACRVDLRTWAKKTDLSPEQAHELGTALLAAGVEAAVARRQMDRDRADRLIAEGLTAADRAEGGAR